MIQIEMCRDCGQPTYTMDVTNLTVRCETAAVDAQEAVRATLAGQQLWAVHDRGLPHARLSPARTEVLKLLSGPTPPTVVREHECPRSVKGSWSASQPAVGTGGSTTYPKARVAPLTASSGPTSSSSTPGSAQSAAIQASERLDGPTCDGCSKPMADGTYAAIELGELLVWAHHVDTCPA